MANAVGREQDLIAKSIGLGTMKENQRLVGPQTTAGMSSRELMRYSSCSGGIRFLVADESITNVQIMQVYNPRTEPAIILISAAYLIFTKIWYIRTRKNRIRTV